ncbi:MAG: hypothetical protein V3T31_01355 [candidate division Zixibacteria bacterium]
MKIASREAENGTLQTLAIRFVITENNHWGRKLGMYKLYWHPDGSSTAEMAILEEIASHLICKKLIGNGEIAKPQS